MQPLSPFSLINRQASQRESVSVEILLSESPPLPMQCKVVENCWAHIIDKNLGLKAISNYIREYSSINKLTVSTRVMLRYRITSLLAPVYTDEQLRPFWIAKTVSRSAEGLPRVLLQALGKEGVSFSWMDALLQVMGVLTGKVAQSNGLLLECGDSEGLWIPVDINRAFRILATSDLDKAAEEQAVANLFTYFRMESWTGGQNVFEGYGVSASMLGLLACHFIKSRQPYCHLLGHILYHAYFQTYPCTVEYTQYQTKLMVHLPRIVERFQGAARTAFLLHVSRAVCCPVFKGLSKAIENMPVTDVDLYWRIELMQGNSLECKRASVLFWEMNPDPNDRAAAQLIRSSHSPFQVALELFRKSRARSGKDQRHLLVDLWKKRPQNLYHARPKSPFVIGSAEESMVFLQFLTDFYEYSEINISDLSEAVFLFLMSELESGIARFTYITRYIIGRRIEITNFKWRNYLIDSLRATVLRNKKGEAWNQVVTLSKAGYFARPSPGIEELQDLVLQIFPVDLSLEKAELVKKFHLQSLDGELDQQIYIHLYELIQQKAPSAVLQAEYEAWFDRLSETHQKELSASLIALAIERRDSAFAYKWWFRNAKLQDPGVTANQAAQLIPLFSETQILRILDEKTLKHFSEDLLFLLCTEELVRPASRTKLCCLLMGRLADLAEDCVRYFDLLESMKKKVRGFVCDPKHNRKLAKALQKDNEPWRLYKHLLGLGQDQIEKKCAIWCVAKIESELGVEQLEQFIRHAELSPDQFNDSVLADRLATFYVGCQRCEDSTGFRDDDPVPSATYYVGWKQFEDAYGWISVCSGHSQVFFAKAYAAKGLYKEAREILRKLPAGTATDDLQQFLDWLDIEKAPLLGACLMLREENLDCQPHRPVQCINLLLTQASPDVSIIGRLLARYKISSLIVWKSAWAKVSRAKDVKTLWKAFVEAEKRGWSDDGHDNRTECWMAVAINVAKLYPVWLDRVLSSDWLDRFGFSEEASPKQDQFFLHLFLTVISYAAAKPSVEGFTLIENRLCDLSSPRRERRFSSHAIYSAAIELSIAILKVNVPDLHYLVHRRICNILAWLLDLDLDPSLEDKFVDLIKSAVCSQWKLKYTALIIITCKNINSRGLQDKIFQAIAIPAVIKPLISDEFRLMEADFVIRHYLMGNVIDPELIRFICDALRPRTALKGRLLSLHILNDQRVLKAFLEKERRTRLSEVVLATTSHYRFDGLEATELFLREALTKDFIFQPLFLGSDYQYLDVLCWLEANRPRDWDGDTGVAALFPLIMLYFEAVKKIEPMSVSIFDTDSIPTEENIQPALLLVGCFYTIHWTDSRLGQRLHLLLAKWFYHLSPYNLFQGKIRKVSVAPFVSLSRIYLSIYSQHCHQNDRYLIEPCATAAANLRRVIGNWLAEEIKLNSAIVDSLQLMHDTAQYLQNEFQAEGMEKVELRLNMGILKAAMMSLVNLYHPMIFTYISVQLKKFLALPGAPGFMTEILGWYQKLLALYVLVPKKGYVLENGEKKQCILYFYRSLIDFLKKHESNKNVINPVHSAAIGKLFGDFVNGVFDRISVTKRLEEQQENIHEIYLLLLDIQEQQINMNLPTRLDAAMWVELITEALEDMDGYRSFTEMFVGLTSHKNTN